ncbi:hypothetical protein CFBP2533_07030 [Xanthomonas hortorum pv. pelargonii]|uniref:Transposase IS200-like domain-containing protein n=2 Tax=Xanthomonas hortorum TaxID=56454 RepID=A0A6V7BVN0_9XANT|nr:transposase [Xanthomonas hortorum]CAD0306309.1 hypothetical protein CFBP2533_07030 [Xanthomonas hortorum pv. pelargonii]CAD0306316.1 hypothetical protein CFBP2533_07030 [Xanthomonas hortorum pv. pelargonii]
MRASGPLIGQTERRRLISEPGPLLFHVHLLTKPPVKGRIGQLMQRLERNYIALFNGRHGRTGTLWVGSYKACLVESADYVLRCYRYIELDPVRVRLTDDPASYH